MGDGKKKGGDSSSSSDKKKAKKDKKVKKEAKKKKTGKKKSSDSSSSGSGAEVQKEKKAKTSKLLPPEEGIKRFEFTVEDTGPLGVRFSGGFPPLILEVKSGTPAHAKGVTPTLEVHAVNGMPLVTNNQ